MRPLSGQADRRARSRAALLEATARGLSRSGYGHLRLDAVAAEDGYTRGALYHQFPDKDALVLATVAWVKEAWDAEVGRTFDEALSAVDALVALARRHAVYPIGAAVRAIAVELVGRVQPRSRRSRAPSSRSPATSGTTRRSRSASRAGSSASPSRGPVATAEGRMRQHGDEPFSRSLRAQSTRDLLGGN